MREGTDEKKMLFDTSGRVLCGLSLRELRLRGSGRRAWLLCRRDDIERTGRSIILRVGLKVTGLDNAQEGYMERDVQWTNCDVSAKALNLTLFDASFPPFTSLFFTKSADPLTKFRRTICQCSAVAKEDVE